MKPGDMTNWGELLLWDNNQSRGWLLAGGQLQVDRVVQTVGTEFGEEMMSENCSCVLLWQDPA
jgi:hypothetical protein